MHRNLDEKRPHCIVRGQKVIEEKVVLAKRMRRQMTPAERTLWERLRRNQLDGFHFRRQQIISGFIVDFYCHRAALAVEVDGDGHDETYDSDRDAILLQHGVRVVRFRNTEVLDNTERVLNIIRQRLLEDIT